MQCISAKLKKVLYNDIYRRILLYFYNRDKFSKEELAKMLRIPSVDVYVNELILLGFLIERNGVLYATASGARMAYNLQALADGPVITLKKIHRRVLDLGCGGGRHLVGIEKSSSMSVGADIDLLSLFTAKIITSNCSELVCCDAHTLPFREGIFDAVIAHGLLPAVDEYKVIAEISRVLEDGGYLYLGIQGLGLFVRLFFSTTTGFRRKMSYLQSMMNTFVYRVLRRKPFKSATFQTIIGTQKILKRHGFQIVKVDIRRRYYIFMELALIEAQKVNL